MYATTQGLVYSFTRINNKIIGDNMSTVQKCPVCEGRGKVDYNFYKDQTGLGISEDCRTCKGIGVLWDYYTILSLPNLPIQDNNLPYNPCYNCPNRNSKTGCFCSLPHKSISY